jgi:hypothetical protein
MEAHMLKPLTLALGLAALASTAFAQSQCPLTYNDFELAIPHLDLEQCPKDLAKPGVFCHVTTANDSVPVFVFAGKDQRCLLSMKSYDKYEISVK